MHLTRVFRTLVFTLFLGGLHNNVTADESSKSVEFSRDIRPILTQHCYACHGPDAAERAAGLRLDIRADAIDMNAISDDAPSDSEILARIYSEDPDMVMPPPETKKPLSDDQKEQLDQWIHAGAEYEKHWSFEPITTPDLPAVEDIEWVRQPMDRFVLSNLEANGLEPAKESPLHHLVRRVTLDLTGLPPTTEQLNSVLDDPSPDAYEHYVDRLLASKKWGEHRGRYWLDYARYADTHGIHFDNFREMWSYRDWVINAFNQNQPFDQFTLEQLAGDLLPHRTLDQQIATGFNRCNITTNEGGIIDEEYLVLYTRDRTETVSQVWLGLTTGCAVCHDHKFDPISQKEFYELSAYFNNSVQGARDGNVSNTPPIVRVPQRDDRQRYLELPTLIESKTAEVAAQKRDSRTTFNQWFSEPKNREKLLTSSSDTIDGLVTHIPLNDNSPTDINYSHRGLIKSLSLITPPAWSDGFVSEKAWKNKTELQPTLPDVGDFDHTDAFTVSLWVHIGKDVQNGSLIAKMDPANEHRGWDVWLENGRLASHLIHSWPANALKIAAKDPLTRDQWHHIAVRYDGSQKVSGYQLFVDGQPVATNTQSESLNATTKTNVPFRIGARDSTSPTPGALLQDIRIYNVALEPAQVNQLKIDSRIAYLAASKNLDSDELSVPQADELFAFYLDRFDPRFTTLQSELAALSSERSRIESEGTIAHVFQEKSDPANAFILARGEYDQRTEEVFPATPAVLPPMSKEYPNNRLGFAKWLISDEHPLTARVTVNRFWQEIFGTGIVPTAGDFGITGANPTHPELLDHLAITFRRDGWDVKEFFRRIVTSSTYKQSSKLTEEKIALDPENAWLSRGPRFRLDAEMLRDYALAVSGLLSDKIGGRSVRPYQPPGVWEAVAMPGSDTRNYRVEQGENVYRRSMYTFWKRAAPPASMEILNAPNREICTVNRERTNTPIQALVTLNDPQFVEAARGLATTLLSTDGLADEVADEDRIQEMAVRLLSREFTDEELGIVTSSLADLRSHYSVNADDCEALLGIGQLKINPSISQHELAAWTMLANELMNLDEMLNK